MDTNKPTILIGPEPSKNPLNSGSWKWFGLDLANELGKYYNVITQKTRDDIKKADCYLVIKSLEFLKKLGDKRKRIYLPVDKLRHATEVKFILDNLPNYTILNNEALQKNIFWHKIYPTIYIPHHIKYFIEGREYYPAPWHRGVYWCGMEGNWKYLEEYLENNVIDWHNKGVKVDCLISDKSRNPDKIWDEGALGTILNKGRNCYVRSAWTEKKHENELRYCSGFLDIKGTDFHQRYKPPTKVLDAIASGVPTAINDCGVRDAMAALGMNLAYPTDTEYWFSKEYFDLTQQWKEIIRRDFHVSKVALQYKEVIDFLLGVK